MKKNVSVWLMYSCLTSLVACAGAPKKLDVGAETFLSSPVELKLKGEVGRRELVKFYSDSNTRAYEKDQIIREKEEIVEFTTESKFKTNDTKNLDVSIRTIKKDGPVSLHDLGFPEKDEKIDFVFAPNGEVLKAGDFAKESLFFIPSMPLPKAAVSKGDTWVMKHTWISSGNNVPLAVEVVGILKRFFDCGGKVGLCAEIEISGNVEAVAVKQAGVDFNSEIHGQMVFSVEHGTLVWSDVKSREDMKTSEGRIQVTSCLGSKMTEPFMWGFDKATEICHPLPF